MQQLYLRSICAALLIALALTGLGLVRPAYAATHTVTNLNDSGAGSLRQAIADAAPNDLITFNAALSGGTIYLASTLTLTKNVEINASSLASPIALSGDTDNNGVGDVRVLSVASGAIVSLDSLLIKMGRAAEGGGIANSGTLSIWSSEIEDNTATSFGGGGINNSGALNIEHSVVAYNVAATAGGGVSNYGSGSLAVSQSLFHDNSAQEGGGIANSSGASATVTNTTLYNNIATTYGGGGINSNGALTLKNSTFSHNTAATTGGGVSNYGGGTLNYSNTIIANSTGGDCFNNSTIGTNTNNLVENGSCSASLSGDPMLGALANNGGGALTMALLPSSPALNAGNLTECSSSPVNGVDQRDVSRPQGAQCDIGAYEAASSLVVTNVNDDESAGSLRNALKAAANGDTITFDPVLSGGTIRLTGGLTIDKNLTIDGSGLALSVIVNGDMDNNGSADTRVFTVSVGTAVVLNSLTITKGFGLKGGGIFNEGVLTVKNSTFSDNRGGMSFGGGGIYNLGNLTVANSSFSGNTTLGRGGGIYNGGYLSVMNSTFSGNSANFGGGGIYNDNIFTYGNLLIANSISGGDCVNGGIIEFPTAGLIEDGSCSASLSGDPNLGPLADNGGPTQTFALLSGSAAIDAGNALICANSTINNLDQRGIIRPQDGDNNGNAVCDIGAYEYIFQPTPTPTHTATPTSTATFTPTPTSTATGIPTFTPTPTSTATFTPTPTSTATGIPTFTPTPTSTATFTPTPTSTTTSIPTLTPTATATPCAAKPPKPTLGVPKNGKTVKKPKVFLDWDDVSCADSYRVLVRLGSSKGTKIVNAKNLPTSQHTTKALTRGQTYYWRASACNAFGCTKSAWQSFKIKP